MSTQPLMNTPFQPSTVIFCIDRTCGHILATWPGYISCLVEDACPLCSGKINNGYNPFPANLTRLVWEVNLATD